MKKLRPIQRETIAGIVFVTLLSGLIALLVTVGAAVNDRNPQTGVDPKVTIVSYVEQVSEINGVRPEVVLAIIDRESNFEPGVTNQSTGCAGLMQLHPVTLEWLERETGCRYDPYDPFQNIAGGVYLLSWLLQRYDGDYNMALLAYAQGYGGAERMVRDGINPSETWQVKTIFERVYKYKGE